MYDTTKDIYDGDFCYTPFIAEDGRVGYRVRYVVLATEGRADAETFIYFNPSVNHGEDEPNVFVYEGIENDPVHDSPVVFVKPDSLLELDLSEPAVDPDSV